MFSRLAPTPHPTHAGLEVIKRLLSAQPRLFMAGSHAQLIHCLVPAFGSAHPAVIGLLCDVLRLLYSAFNVSAPDLPKEVQVHHLGPLCPVVSPPLLLRNKRARVGASTSP